MTQWCTAGGWYGGINPKGSVKKKRTVCKLQKTHATDRHTTLSTRPLIARDAEEHMLGKSKGKECHVSAMCRHMVPTSLAT